MKIYKNIWFLFFMTVTSVLLSSCSDDDNSGGQPVIESVRVTDPALADETFTQATPGKMIVIQGRNLGGCRELYINDQKVGFNPNMNTNHSIITTIPTEENDNFKLTGLNPDLASEIRVVTAGGVATFAFKVLAPKPEGDRVAADYPRRAGDVITVFGSNFIDIERIYFSDANPLQSTPNDDGENKNDNVNDQSATRAEGQKPVEIDVTDYKVSHDRYIDQGTKKYVTNSKIELIVPELPFNNGFIVIKTLQGSASVEFAAIPQPPVMMTLSSDMPIPGTKVTITGTNFIAVQGVKIGDKIAIDAEDIEVADNERELSFIMPEKPAASTTISVVTAGGTTNEFRFYPYETLLLDFDNLGKDCNWGSNVPYPIATPDAEPYISDGKFAKFDVNLTAWNYDGPEIRWDSKSGTFALPSFDIIPADTPIENVYFKYEIYNKYVFTKEMRYTIRDASGKDHAWINYDGNKKHIIPEYQDQFGSQKYGEWYTAVLSLKHFPDMNNVTTYGDFVNLGIKRILWKLYNRTGSVENVFTCIDNIRISTIETYQPEK